MKIDYAEGCDNYVELPTMRGDFKVEFFDNPRLEGEPAATHAEKTLNGGWWFATPDPAVKSMQYSARWSTKLNVAQTGRYAFGVGSSCDAQVFIDGRVIVASGQPDVMIDLEAGKDYEFKVGNEEGR